MMFDPIKIYKLKSDVPDLKYATEYAACMDVSAYLKFSSSIKSYSTDNKEIEVLVSQDKDGKDFIDIPANWRVLIPTGMIFDLPKDVHLKVYPRSGLSTKKGLNLINCTGIIDEDYINELKLVIIGRINITTTLPQATSGGSSTIQREDRKAIDIIKKEDIINSIQNIIQDITEDVPEYIHLKNL